MNEKQMKLIESGMKLFATKGYHRTSVQEITSEAGVSKGSFYVYFQSKEEFMLTAYQYFYTRIKEKIERVKVENLSPRESLAKQITVWLQYIYEHKDFIILHMKENISIAGSVDEWAKEIKVDSYHWMRENIENIHGKQEIKPILFDLVIQMEGLLHSYTKWKIVDDVNLEVNQVGPFLVRRLDDLVKGMQERQEAPLISFDELSMDYEAHRQACRSIPEILLSLKRKVQALALPSEKIDQLQAVMEVLETELSKKEWQPVVVQGLLAHFKPISEIEAECQDLARLLDVELLS
ncbi:TetR/AcrR family transcriptional regulator [Mesobacillus maritimus]|uniref:TetR/AcrR family transcriptional regulator n=1 Tax=Mesobacillus maritimus TaxID=1643336 RepID=UPI0038514CBD